MKTPPERVMSGEGHSGVHARNKPESAHSGETSAYTQDGE